MSVDLVFYILCAVVVIVAVLVCFIADLYSKVDSLDFKTMRIDEMHYKRYANITSNVRWSAILLDLIDYLGLDYTPTRTEIKTGSFEPRSRVSAKKKTTRK